MENTISKYFAKVCASCENFLQSLMPESRYYYPFLNYIANSQHLIPSYLTVDHRAENPR